ncbi:MFS transporter [Thermocrispum sp.]|uniref:MFS transporter n=1 Tax=Thermocrispum agreste TaxID=37925 RepID=A0ABD6FAK6_9PSEU|nr:MFS transporter [Thermocrispum sp.]
MFRSLRHRDYRLYWSGMFVSNAGTWMQRVAQDWLVLVTLGGGATAVGITTGLQFLPFLLAAPFGGVLADRLPKRQLLIATNGFLGLVALVLGVLVVSGQAEIWHVYVLAFLLGVGTAFDNPARQAFVSELVGQEDITNAVALNSASFNGARLLGPAVAGVLIAVLGPGPVFLLNGLSFAAPIIALLLIKPSDVPSDATSDDRDGPLARMAAGVRYLRGRRDLVMVMVVMFGVGTFGMNFQMTNALMAADVYHRGPSAYGLLGTIMAIGTLSGALLAARRKAPRLRVVLTGAVSFGVLEAASGLMPSYELFAAALVPIGVLTMTVLTSANAYIQTTVPAAMRGRVLSLYLMLLMGGTPVGAPIIGWVAGELGARWSLLGGGALTVAFTVAAYLALNTRPEPGVRALLVHAHLRPLHTAARTRSDAPKVAA